MARKVVNTRKKKRRRQLLAPKTRDPFWRERRALGQSRVDSRKAYKRSGNRVALRRSEDEG